MATLALSTLLLALALLVVEAEYDPDICKPFKESYGLIPPPLPRDYEGKADFVDYNQKTVRYEEMHFDYSNNRGKFMLLSNGIEKHILFDYKTKQVILYDILHPGKNYKDDPLSWGCEAIDVQGTENREMFGYRDVNMLNSYETLQYGQSYGYAYNGTYRMDQRGLLVDSFAACIYDQDLEATLRMNYSFTNAVVYTSGGTTVQEVLGVEDGMLPVLTKMEEFGAITDRETGETQLINTTTNLFWFKGEPEFALNTFKLPVYMYCENYRGAKKWPSMPDAFSTRVQVTKISRDSLGALDSPEVTSYEEVYYYKSKSLARRDFIPDPDRDTDIKNILGLDPVRVVYDFNTGVKYITSVLTNKCKTTYIPIGDPYDAEGQHMYIEMAGPEDIFRMQSKDKQYKGSHFIRDIETDVYVGKYIDPHHNNASYIKETYITTNGWHEEADDLLEYAVPIKHVLFPEQLSGELVENITEYHFFKFRAAPPRLMAFDVSNCIETIKHKEYAIILRITEEEKRTAYKYKGMIQEAAQFYLTEITQVFSPLRIQRVQLRQLSLSDTRATLAFTLVGKATLRTNTPIGQPGANLDAASKNLRDFIDRNQFSFKFTPPKQNREDKPEPFHLKALRGDLYERTAGGLQAPEREDYEDEAVPTIAYADEEGGEEKKGMKPGSLAVLALAMLFIGIGIGIAVMYLYLRKKSDSVLEDRITLQVSKGADE